MSATNDYICGVNWSSMKKIAKFAFGEKNVVSFRKTDNRRYIIYITKAKFYEDKGFVDYFENFWKVSVKPLED